MVPVGLLAHHFSLIPSEYTDDGLATLAYIIFGVPILIFNFWVWSSPQTLEDLLFKKDK